MDKIRENLYLGDSSDASWPELLKKEKITAILNVAFEINDKITDPNIKVIKIGLADDAIKQNHMIILAVNALNELMIRGEKVLVHCAVGMSRSPFIVANYIAMHETKSLESIYEEMKKIRPIVDMNTPLWWGKHNE